MCDWSKAFDQIRNAIQGEVLVVTKTNYHKVMRPLIPEARIQCVCLQNGYSVRFQGLPLAFQEKYAVPANAVATFIEGKDTGSRRDEHDRFDFHNTYVVAMAQIPEETQVIVGRKVQLLKATTRKKVERMARVIPVMARQPGLVGAATSLALTLCVCLGALFVV